MRKLILLSLLIAIIFIFGSFCSVEAQQVPPFAVEEEDGEPSVWSPYKIKFSNDSVTDNLDGTVSISIITTETDPNVDTSGEIMAIIGADGINDTYLDWGIGSNQISAVDIPIADAGSVITATEVETALQEVKLLENYANSPMIVTGGEISEGTNAGTFKVAALTALLRATDSLTGALTYVTLSEQDNQSIPAADTTYFVCLDYNDGSPQIVLSETNPYSRASSPDRTQIPLGKVMKDGSDNIHYTSCGFGFQDGIMKLHQRAGMLRAHELNGGSTIAYKADNCFTMTSGVAYAGINRITLDAYDSSVTQFTPVYRDGAGGWTEGAASNTIDYTHYDDGDGTLGNVGNNKYGCFWVYKHMDDNDVYVLYGRGSYTLAEAEVVGEPSRPDHLTDFGLLIGKIIVPQAGGSFTAVQMITDTFFVGTDVSNHNELGSLQGGTTDEYYHLTNAEHTIATQAATSSQSGYLTSTDWNTFNDKIGTETDPIVGAINGIVKADGAGNISAATANTDYEPALTDEASLESTLTDVTNVFTNNDGTLADDDLSDNNLSDLGDIQVTIPADGHLLLYDGVTDNRFENVAMSGDVTITNAGVTSLSTDSVADNEIDYTAVTLNDLTFDVGNVSKTEFGYLDGVTSSIQTQIDGKEGTLTNSAGLAAALSDETGTGLAVFGTSPTFTTQITTPKITNAGNVEVDAVNAATDSTVSITNSDATYKANLTVEGNASAATYGSDGSVSDAELLYINTLSSNAQDQLDGKQTAITGTDTHVMFFDGANNPAGDAGMTYNKTTDSLTLAGDLAVNGGDIISFDTISMQACGDDDDFLGFLTVGNIAKLLPNEDSVHVIGSTNLVFAEGWFDKIATDGDLTLDPAGNDVILDNANLQIQNNYELRFYDNGNYVGFEAPALDANQIWILPTADGNANEVLTTNGAGVLSWTTAGSGDITDVGDATSGAAFTADGTGNSLWFEGATAAEF